MANYYPRNASSSRTTIRVDPCGCESIQWFYFFGMFSFAVLLGLVLFTGIVGIGSFQYENPSLSSSVSTAAFPKITSSLVLNSANATYLATLPQSSFPQTFASSFNAYFEFGVTRMGIVGTYQLETWYSSSPSSIRRNTYEIRARWCKILLRPHRQFVFRCLSQLHSVSYYDGRERSQPLQQQNNRCILSLQLFRFCRQFARNDEPYQSGRSRWRNALLQIEADRCRSDRGKAVYALDVL